jgi:hypothetical protein
MPFFHLVLQKDILRPLIGSLMFDTPLDINDEQPYNKAIGMLQCTA